MESDVLQNLRESLKNYRTTYFQYLKAKGKEKQNIQEDLTRMADSMIEEYKLFKYDTGIKEERHKAKFFISDVEHIIDTMSDPQIG